MKKRLYVVSPVKQAAVEWHKQRGKKASVRILPKTSKVDVQQISDYCRDATQKQRKSPSCKWLGGNRIQVKTVSLIDTKKPKG